MNCSNSDCSLALIKLGTRHMLKQEKTLVSQAIIKLSTSRIFNLIDTRFEVAYKSNVSPIVWQTINEVIKMTHAAKENYLSEGAIKLLGQIVEQQSSKAMLKFIDKGKYLLSSCDKDSTEAYAVLLIVEQVQVNQNGVQVCTIDNCHVTHFIQRQSVRNFNRHQESDLEATCCR
ncbi:hypothetical protein BCV72DRAFT_232298 [Rhizopus microsporus var. microsporus]|uniref:Uncharacterized protein n=2 Tax=Rhizopus microsporus TaxID=58291 RepID=A0A2G4SNU2_RHIZD|nr:uncharacterized protein RHIMIDRAFT_260832 [Rhizopus microsporus ATCC 52813]ORE03969.1 hypothetical protein BCV72DRAFT_232298 [Rhizopus microsporus var. microsporus]PHZ10434.1 hypothetical protein RHIMIDRAFT_260832 [Rhizopus microsporus ATCC 52813]